MKHKVLFGLATAAMAAVMCVGFAACGGGVEASGVKGEEVSKEQWNAARNELEDKYESQELQLTIVYQEKSESEMSMTVDGKSKSVSGKSSGKITYVINGKKASKKGSTETKVSGDTDIIPEEGKASIGKVTYEEYSEVTDTGVYVTKKNDDGKWERKLGSRVYSQISSMLALGDYEDYVYNQDLKGYVSKYYDAEEDDDYLVYKFKDGKLAAVYSYYEEKDEMGETKVSAKSEMGYTISYEAKDVNIPSAD